MTKDENLDGFLIICPDCEKKKLDYKTMLYVDWDKRIYTISCQNCGKLAYFDFYGNLVPKIVAKDIFSTKSGDTIIN